MIEVKCATCGSLKKIKNCKKREKNYCSHECFYKSKNPNYGQDRKCKNCSLEIKMNIGSKNYNKFYCSKNCQHKHKKLTTIEKIENGDTTLSSRAYRKYLIDKHGAKCMKCGWSEINPYSGTTPIELEHKDGNSENNSLDNLELLCPNCHSLTKTYKGLNRGNGRHQRMERYRNGDSY